MNYKRFLPIEMEEKKHAILWDWNNTKTMI